MRWSAGRWTEGSAVRLQAKGLADDAFRARLITPRLLAEQAAVLLMATEHREPVLDEAPAVHRRTFTIRELAHAIDDIGERHDWPTLLDAAGADDVVSRWRALPAAGGGPPRARPRQPPRPRRQ